MGKGDGPVGARGIRAGQIVIPVGQRGLSTENAMRVTRVSGGVVYGTGATAPAGSFASREMATTKGTKFVRYPGTLTGDRYADTTSLSSFGRNRGKSRKRR